MNKRILLFSIFALSTFISFAQVPVEQVQRTLMTKVTATWCSNCGSWGWNYFENVIADNNDGNAIFFKAHYSGNLVSTAGQTMATNFGANGQPQFFINNTKQTVNSGNTAAAQTEAQSTIAENATSNPIANVGLKAYEGFNNDLEIHTTTEFFQATSGDFFTSVYVVEDNIIEQQAGNSNTAEHTRILRTSFSTDVFGEAVASGNVSEGMSVDKIFNLPIDATWNQENLRFVAVLWKKVNNTYEFVNASEDTDLEALVSSTSILNNRTAVNVFPTVTENGATVQFELQDEVQQASIQLYDMAGKMLQTIYNGSLSSGTHNYQIEQTVENGMFLVQVRLDNQTIIRKLIFQ